MHSHAEVRLGLGCLEVSGGPARPLEQASFASERGVPQNSAGKTQKRGAGMNFFSIEKEVVWEGGGNETCRSILR